MKTTIMMFAAAVLVAGCASGGGDTSEPPAKVATACEAAMGKAAQVDEMQDAGEDLYPAFSACTDLAEFEKAAGEYPDALDGADPTMYVENGCLSVKELEATAVCKSVG